MGAPNWRWSRGARGPRSSTRAAPPTPVGSPKIPSMQADRISLISCNRDKVTARVLDNARMSLFPSRQPYLSAPRCREAQYRSIGIDGIDLGRGLYREHGPFRLGRES